MNKIRTVIKIILALFISQAMSQEMGVGGWEILRDGQWEERKWTIREEKRIFYAQELYEELDPRKLLKLVLPKKRIDPYGLKIKNSYLVWNEGWFIINTLLNYQASVKLFYAPERKWSRQFTFDQFLKFTNPDYKSRHIWVDFPDGLKIAMDKNLLATDEDEKTDLFAFGELGGYGIFLKTRDRTDLSRNEAIEMMGAIFGALNGKKKYAYYPKRAQGLQYQLFPKQVKGHVVPQFKGTQRDEAFKEGNDYREMANEYLYINDEAVRLLNTDAIYPARKDNEPNLPPRPINVGTHEWIKKHIKEPFKLNHEDNKNLPYYAISGKFIIEQNNQKYPIECTVTHLLSKAQAIDGMIYSQVRNDWRRPKDMELIKFFRSILHFQPGLGGEYDVCLKSILNDLGQIIRGSEHTWMSFVRGNTVVTLRDPSMNISVLPMAKKIDQALKAEYDKMNAPEIMK